MLDNLTRRITGVFANLRRKGRLTEDDVTEMLREIRIALLEADVNILVAKKFIARVKEKAVGEEVYGSLNADQTLIKIVKDEVVEMLGGDEVRMNWGSAPPTVILMCGLQGSGKTTTTAKLARWLKQQGKKPLLAACDLQRPGAITQLQVLGEQVEAPVFVGEPGQSPVQVAEAALARAKHMFNDVLVVDTAGRLSIDAELMTEIGNVAKAVKPNEVFLVLDSTTGQEAVNVAQAFHERLQVTGTIFTKLDGDARGGAVLSVRESTGVPVRFIGIGEQTDALDQFYPERMAQRIIGMGDVMGIIEKAEQAISQEDAMAMEKTVKSGAVDFNTLLQQFAMMRKMGSWKKILGMIPGVTSMLPEGAMDSIKDEQIYRVEAIILSMTAKERSNPDILNGSRRKRIAIGSGTTVEEVNALVKQLYEMRRTFKAMGKMKMPKPRR
ncbi:MAG: signal recognition particle protein [Chthonomonas sp.]|nr:signal recognition particle protein [Chthonomonas sp.]